MDATLGGAPFPPARRRSIKQTPGGAGSCTCSPNGDRKATRRKRIESDASELEPTTTLSGPLVVGSTRRRPLTISALPTTGGVLHACLTPWRANFSSVPSDFSNTNSTIYCLLLVRPIADSIVDTHNILHTHCLLPRRIYKSKLQNLILLRKWTQVTCTTTLPSDCKARLTERHCSHGAALEKLHPGGVVVVVDLVVDRSNTSPGPWGPPDNIEDFSV